MIDFIDDKDDGSTDSMNQPSVAGSDMNKNSCRSNANSCTIGGKCWIAVIILVVIGIIIIGIFFWLSNYLRTHEVNPNDGLGKILSTVPGAGATFWEATHLILFGILGFFFPCCDAVIISIGAFWEIIEHYLGLTTCPIQLPGSSSDQKVQWWYGSAVDIAVNIIGFYIGKAIRLTIYPPPPSDKPKRDSSNNTDPGITFYSHI